MQAPVEQQRVQVADNGIPRTINRRVKVHMIAQKYGIGQQSPADIAEHYGITLADVHAALAYYYSNRAYFDERERAVEPIIEQARAYTAELKAKIQQRMQVDNDDN
jgi:uncharacterized protein (DUF433 family)